MQDKQADHVLNNTLALDELSHSQKNELIVQLQQELARLNCHILSLVSDIDQNKKQAQKLRELSSFDSLTKVANRRYFDERITEEWRRGIRSKQTVSVLMIDLDFFKLYNDTYGHQAGDKCLQQIAEILKHSVKRAGDFVARYGGEEFIALLPDTDTQGAISVANKMTLAVNKLAINHPSTEIGEHVTLSIGVASQVPARGNKYQSLIEAADKALYQAKAQGRNAIVVGSHQ